MVASPTKKAMDEVPNHDSQDEMPVTPVKRDLSFQMIIFLNNFFLLCSQLPRSISRMNE